MKIFILALLILSMPSLGMPANEVLVLNGTPLVQQKGTIENSENYQLSENQKNEYRVLIVKNDDGYFWESRERRPLIKEQSGAFSIFIEPGGAGYIKVIESNGTFLYMEHMSIGFQTLTYWGVSDNYKP